MEAGCGIGRLLARHLEDHAALLGEHGPKRVSVRQKGDSWTLVKAVRCFNSLAKVFGRNFRSVCVRAKEDVWEEFRSVVAVRQQQPAYDGRTRRILDAKIGSVAREKRKCRCAREDLRTGVNF
jgi:hypothetical protein